MVSTKLNGIRLVLFFIKNGGGSSFAIVHL